MAETQALNLNQSEVNEAPAQADAFAADGGLKRDREDAVEIEENIETKKLKVDNSKEENPVKETTEEENVSVPEAVAEEKLDRVSIGAKTFGSSVEAFDHFYKFLHHWTPNINVNQYEHAMLLELLKNGHAEADKKIGAGVKAFQVRFHPQFKSRCFFLVREDESSDDFSFRKCVDHISPLPENMQVKQDVNKALGGRHGGRGGRGGGRGGGHGGGRGRGRGRRGN